MPTYEFACFGCNKLVEKRMKISEYSENKDSMYCDDCGAVLKPKVSSPHFKLEGTGWYRDGYFGGVNTQKELDSELRQYDSHRNNQENNIYDREIEE